MNTCRTDSTNYHRTSNWSHVDITAADQKVAINNEVEKIEEFFVWSDDKDGITDKANEIIKSSEELQAILTKLVCQSIGTGMIYSKLNDDFNIQVEASVKAFAASQVEKSE